MIHKDFPLLSPIQLNAMIELENLVVLDASQAKNQNGKVNQTNEQIVGARWFDLKGVFSDCASPFPAMMPAPKQFEKECRSLGINQKSIIVIYDDIGIYFSPRVWWMFKSMGHNQVFILNGGLPAWRELGFPTENKPSKFEVVMTGNFRSVSVSNGFVDSGFVKKGMENNSCLLIDARTEDRYKGTVKETRAGLRNGHIPTAINIPFESVLVSGKYKDEDDLRKVISDLEMDNLELVFYCGSGITACIVLLAFAILDYRTLSVYDGSWTEWGSNDQNPVD